MGTHLNCIDNEVDAIQISTHNICLYKEVEKKYTCYNLKTTELLDCLLIGVCEVIRSNMVCFCGEIRKVFIWILLLSRALVRCQLVQNLIELFLSKI